MTEAQDARTDQSTSSTFYDGSEPVFGTFTQTQITLNATRMTLDEEVQHPLSELASDIETTRRIFLHDGNVVTALQAIRRIENAFESRVQLWEAAVTERNRNKHTRSGGDIAKMKAEIARVRIRINLTRRALSKIKVELHTIANQIDDADILEPTQKKKSEADPRLQELLKTSFTAGIMNQLIGDGINLAYYNAKRMIVGHFGAREDAWDPKLSVMLIVGWYPAIGRHIKADRFEIRTWLVPKSPTAMADLVDDHEKLCLAIRIAGSLPVDLHWQWVEADSELTPQSHSLQPFIQRIKEERFTPSNQPMRLLSGTCKEVFWKNSSTQLYFRAR